MTASVAMFVLYNFKHFSSLYINFNLIFHTLKIKLINKMYNINIYKMKNISQKKRILNKFKSFNKKNKITIL